MSRSCCRDLDTRQELVNIISQTSTAQRSDTSCFTIRLLDYGRPFRMSLVEVSLNPAPLDGIATVA